MGIRYIIPFISVLFEMSVVKSEKTQTKEKTHAITDFLT